jgi:hypothetical protein
MTTKKLPAAKEKFPPALAFDEAMNCLAGLSGKPLAWTDEDYLAIYGYSSEQLQLFREDPEFIKATHLAVQDLKENGGSIKEKSRQQLEFYLDNYVKDMMDAPLDQVPAKDKLAIMTMLGKFSGMADESKAAADAKASNTQSGPTFTLVLTTPTPVEPAYTIIQQEPSK